MDNPTFHVTCLLELFLAAKSIHGPGNRKRDHWTKFSEMCRQLILPGQYVKSKQTLGNSKTCKNSQANSAAVCCTPVSSLHLFIAEQSQNTGARMLSLVLNSNWCKSEAVGFTSMENTLEIGIRFPLELSAYPENTKSSARVEQIRNTLQIINCGLTVDLMTEHPGFQGELDERHFMGDLWEKRTISVIGLIPKRHSPRVMADNALILYRS